MGYKTCIMNTVTNLQQSYRHFKGKKILACTSLFHSSAEEGVPHQEQAVPDVFFNILCWVKKSRTLLMQHWAPIHKLEDSCLSNLNHEHLNILQFHLTVNISLSQIYQLSYPYFLILSFWASCFQISASYTILEMPSITCNAINWLNPAHFNTFYSELYICLT